MNYLAKQLKIHFSNFNRYSQKLTYCNQVKIRILHFYFCEYFHKNNITFLITIDNTVKIIYVNNSSKIYLNFHKHMILYDHSCKYEFLKVHGKIKI